MLVRVLTDDGGSKPVGLVARVVENKNDETYVIQYLSPTEERDTHGRTIYAYEEKTYEIDDDYVIEYMDDEGDVGYVAHGNDTWIKRRRHSDDDDDEDYHPSDEEEEEDEEESESCDDSGEEFTQDEDYEDYDDGDD
jgi:hypothetical protein